MTFSSHMESIVALAQSRLAESKGDLRQLPIPFLTVLLVYSAQGQIDNGGLTFFFENDWPGNPDYQLFSDAFRRIGSSDVALHLDHAVAMFPFSNPHLDAERRIAFITVLSEHHSFHTISDSLCGDSSVWSNLADFIKEHFKDVQRA